MTIDVVWIVGAGITAVLTFLGVYINNRISSASDTAKEVSNRLTDVEAELVRNKTIIAYLEAETKEIKHAAIDPEDVRRILKSDIDNVREEVKDMKVLILEKLVDFASEVKEMGRDRGNG